MSKLRAARALSALLVLAMLVFQPASASANENTEQACDDTDVLCVLRGVVPSCDDLIEHCDFPQPPSHCPAREDIVIASGGVFLTWDVQVYCYGSLRAGDSRSTYYVWNITIKEEPPGAVVGSHGGDGYVTFTSGNTQPRSVASGTHSCNLTPGVLTYATGSGFATNSDGQGTTAGQGAPIYCN